MDIYVQKLSSFVREHNYIIFLNFVNYRTDMFVKLLSIRKNKQNYWKIMLGIFFVIVNEMTMAPWLYIDMCCTWLKWKPLHEMNEKMKTLNTCLLWLFALCYNILISKENVCGTCILNQNFILRDIMTQLVKVTNVRKIEGYQELYTFIINWQPLKFQYESPKKVQNGFFQKWVFLL